MATSKRQDDPRQTKEAFGPSLLEWVAGALGALIAIAMLVILSVEAIETNGQKVPALSVQPSSIAQGGGSYVVEVKVSNASSTTAAAVEVEGVLMDGARTVESSRLSLSYVPGHSERDGGLIFSRDPRQYQLQLRATGYERP